MRRWGAAALAACMLTVTAGACRSRGSNWRGTAEGGSTDAAGSRSTSPTGGGVGGGASPTTAAGAAGSNGSAASGGKVATPPAGGSTTGTRGGVVTGGTSPPGAGSGGPSSAQAQIASAASGPVGGFARVLLQPQPASGIVAEVLAQQGAAPRAATTQHLSSDINAASGKQVSLQSTPLAGAARSWSAADLETTADQHTRFTQGANGAAVLHLLYLHGDFNGDQSVLGVAVRGDVLAVFTDRLQAAATVAVPERVLEDAVSIHETGHVLGLVDLVLHTGRQDPDHPGHSTNKGSVMYWAVDTDLVNQLLDGGPSTEFDDADRRDLATIRNGG